MTILRVDLETYSATDLIKSGVYRYVEDPDFEILLFGFAFDDDPVQVIDLTDFEGIPNDVLRALQSDVIKTAFNANFERTAIWAGLGIECPPEFWRCTMVHALTLGLPGSLDKVANVLNLAAQKDARGKALIKYFSVPRKPPKADPLRTRNYAHHDPEKWETFKEYCAQDVRVERDIAKRLDLFPVPAHEWRLWALDQRINDRGVHLDEKLFRAAIACDRLYEARLVAEAQEITGLENPNSLQQLKTWLAENGLDTPDGLGKDYMPILLDQAPTDDVRRVLELRREMSKTSVDKYKAMARSVCRDGNVRGLLQYCGANRTWRWAGRLVQVQNLPQNKLKDLGAVRELLRDREYETIELVYGPPPFVLSQLVRTAFIPKLPGSRFAVADFNAIEARVIAWLADEQWVLDVFRSGGKIYETTAANMFGVPLETIVEGHKNYELRARGKVAVLACGYQGGVGALEAMDSKKEIDPDEYPRLVAQWREANPNIKKLWYAAERAAVKAVKEKTTVKLKHGVKYRYDRGILFADLPSGRSLAYVNPRLEWDEKFEKDGLVFDGMDQETKRWGKQRTYGGKLTENLVQAIARDCLAVAMERTEAAGYPTVLHVHDEICADIQGGSVEEMIEIMGQPIEWAPGLPLKAAGFECEFYQKD